MELMWKTARALIKVSLVQSQSKHLFKHHCRFVQNFRRLIMSAENNQIGNENLKRSSEAEECDEVKKPKLDEPKLMPPRVKKKMYAVLLSYSGKGYYGMQRNPGASLKTIEGDFLSAMLKTGLIDRDLYDYPQAMFFQRASRTDKGVSAVRQIVSLKLPLGLENSIPEINAHLPEQIRVVAMKIAKNRFDAKIHCDSRSYSYILPTFAFAPPDVITDESFRISDKQIEEIQEILDMFIGSHFYHNYTSGKKSGEDSARRVILQFKVGKPFNRQNVEFVILQIKGQSFMLHQIRKMVAMVISIMRGFATKDTLAKSRKVDKMDIPIAPGLGLILEEVHYDKYNERFKGDGIHDLLIWTDYESLIEEMREKYIYKHIIDEEVKEKSMLNWLETIILHTFDVRPEGGVEVDYKRQSVYGKAIKIIKEVNEELQASTKSAEENIKNSANEELQVSTKSVAENITNSVNEEPQVSTKSAEENITNSVNEVLHVSTKSADKNITNSACNA